MLVYYLDFFRVLNDKEIIILIKRRFVGFGLFIILENMFVIDDYFIIVFFEGKFNRSEVVEFEF